jgi:hypothetical protein
VEKTKKVLLFGIDPEEAANMIYFGGVKSEGDIGVWQGVAMDSLKFHPDPSTPCGWLPLKQPYGRVSQSLPVFKKYRCLQLKTFVNARRNRFHMWT